MYVLPAASGNKLIQPGPFINHTDSELALIEELVGRTTPFAYSGGAYEVPRKRNYKFYACWTFQTCSWRVYGFAIR